jgi:hypothetical protein
MKNYILLLLFFLITGFSHAARAEACYNLIEAEAEQGIRIHSELMVIGLNCAHMSANGQGMYQQYTDFTKRHKDLISRYEQILIDFYKRSGDPAPDQKINKLRTDVANRISNDVAKMRPDHFCKQYMSRISTAAAMDRQQVRSWAQTFFTTAPVSRPFCNGVNVSYQR